MTKISDSYTPSLFNCVINNFVQKICHQIVKNSHRALRSYGDVKCLVWYGQQSKTQIT